MQSQETEEKERRKKQNEASELSVRVEVLKALCEIAQSELESMVQGSIGPFLERTRDLCEGILPGKICYINGELGMEHNEGNHVGFHSWKSFSGTEKALFLCAVQIALAAESGMRIAMLDEAGRLDTRNRELVTRRLLNLIDEKRIEQALLVDAGNLAWWKNLCEDVEINQPDTMSVVEIKA